MRVNKNTKFGILALLLSGTFLVSGAMANSDVAWRTAETSAQRDARLKRDREERRKQREQAQRIIQANKTEEQNRKQQEKAQKIEQESFMQINRDDNDSNYESESKTLDNKALEEAESTLLKVIEDTKEGNKKLEQVQRTLNEYKNM